MKNGHNDHAPDFGAHFGERLLAARLAQGLTQFQLSMKTAEIGHTVAPSAISGLESGRRKRPRLDTIQALEAALGVNLRNGKPALDRGYITKSLKVFLESEVARGLTISKDEQRELEAIPWFNPDESPSPFDWGAYVMIRRRIRKNSLK
ncbi:MAG: hypothetical protein CMF70_06835 [Magnetovibrio sp.]|nr:hypothetical protein [Magnetovibrio sp.]|tara:strand:+ start:309 stop:755 length:447 start_codon:yes stop_codon:yes gene_type:complete